MGQPQFKTLALLLLLSCGLRADQPCASCHPKEVEGYAKSGMARSLAPVTNTPVAPDGSFEHAFSQTRFVIHSAKQSFSRKDESGEESAAFVIGSGNHAFGFLVEVGDRLFQSPLSYYTKRQIWDVAPGYEQDPHPDFSRPVTAECVFCHSGKPLPVTDSVNRFQPGMFAEYGISCERCHGDATAHLKNPVKGSILNPASMHGTARASVCEQCHLTGETRIPNPGKTISDFKPGQVLEDFYTTYVAAQAQGESIKVVSHAEQLALSMCARKSGDKLWCGTCHNPHDKPAQPAAYFRDRCLSCHAATLDVAHAAPGRDCVGCHMPKSPTKDGGHTAFTNHRIARNPEADSNAAQPDTLNAWRDPGPALRDRNLALALVTVGLETKSSAEVIRGYRLLNQVVKSFPDDPAVLTSLGSVLMKGKQPAEALKCFERAASTKPNYAPYYVDIAAALVAADKPAEAVQPLKKALALEPLLEQAVELLGEIYTEEGRTKEAEQLIETYDEEMHISRH